MIRGISHVALQVLNVVEAETYYTQLFALRVAFRDLVLPEGQYSLRPGETWEVAGNRGQGARLSALARDGVLLALQEVDHAGAGQLDHVGFDVDPAELAAQRARMGGLGCSVLAERADLLVFRDRMGIQWELSTAHYANPADMSTGARTGRWFTG
jgi:catechol 2,3-dioxygenase-like lactoylglutathione lyase family enzyme